MRTVAGRRLGGVIAACVIAAACGQKGPPLPPLHRLPNAVSELSLRRVEDQARLRFVLPTQNANAPGPIDLARVEIYAMTAPAGVTPPNRDLLVKANLVGEIAVRPAPVEGEPVDTADTRPGPGDTVTFDEQLTEAKLTPPPRPAAAAPTPGKDAAVAAPAATATEPPAVPAADTSPATQPTAPAVTAPEPPPAAQPPTTQPAPAAPATATPDAAPATAQPPAAAAATPAAPALPMRIYAVRGVSRGGRAGAPSRRVQFPIGPLPPAPAAVKVRTTETAVVLEWTAPTTDPGVSFNVYRPAEPMQPVTPAPVQGAAFEHTGLALGQEYCYQLRSVQVSPDAPVEGALSEQVCVTPRDTFPPAAPRGLAAVPTPGQISLIWDANTEKDLAGYVVLRGEPGGELKAITAAPIRETSYRDASVTPGVRYAYSVVAVDSADPANVSPRSAVVEETAR